MTNNSPTEVLPPNAATSLCSSASTFSAIGMAFLGYWGFSSDKPWVPLDFFSLIPVLAGIGALAYVPWACTRPSTDNGLKDIARGRKAFICGVSLILFGIVATLFT